MRLYSFWNQLKRQLKKKLRRKRGWLHLAAVLLAFGAVTVCVALWQKERGTEQAGLEARMTVAKPAASLQSEEEVRTLVSGLDGQRDVYARKAYVCGEELQWIGLMSAADILSYHQANPAMVVKLGEGQRVYFTEQIQDLSPQCKDNAYFGLDAAGNLSLFEGIPGMAGSNVIRTFFQLNVQYLESSLPRETVKQLYSGIRVKDLEDYNSVLSTLSDFAIEETEKVMQQETAR